MNDNPAIAIDKKRYIRYSLAGIPCIKWQPIHSFPLLQITGTKALRNLENQRKVLENDTITGVWTPPRGAVTCLKVETLTINRSIRAKKPKLGSALFPVCRQLHKSA